MTGFCSKNMVIDGVSFAVSMKSLNGRFFDVTCRLPYSLNFLETDIIKRIKPVLRRGTVLVIINQLDGAGLTTNIEPSLEVVAGYIRATDAIKKQYSLPGLLDIKDIVGLPNVFQVFEKGFGHEQTIGQLLDGIEELAQQVQKARSQEGQVLRQDIVSRLATMKTLFEKMDKRAQLVQAEREEQIKKAMAELAQPGSVTHEQMMPLLSAYIERIDVHEELVRFMSHYQVMNETVNSQELEQGKKLEFILQEMFREVNTINAKCADGLMSTVTVELRVELEKVREQIQNIV
jgi:uncharacterized protein (TIGR00255 family)